MNKTTVRTTRRVIRLAAEGTAPIAISKATGLAVSTVLAIREREKPAIATVRKEMVANADADHILSRNEVLRIHSVVGLSAIESDPEARHPDSHKSLVELSKLQSYYEAPKTGDAGSTRDAQALALANSPLFQDYLRQEAAVLRAGKIIDIEDTLGQTPPPAIPRPEISAEDRERQEAEDRAYAELMGMDYEPVHVPDAPAVAGASKRAACVTLYEPTGPHERTVD